MGIFFWKVIFTVKFLMCDFIDLEVWYYYSFSNNNNSIFIKENEIIVDSLMLEKEEDISGTPINNRVGKSG
jgi:hypothetical protein